MLLEIINPLTGHLSLHHAMPSLGPKTLSPKTLNLKLRTPAEEQLAPEIAALETKRLHTAALYELLGCQEFTLFGLGAFRLQAQRRPIVGFATQGKVRRGTKISCPMQLRRFPASGLKG